MAEPAGAALPIADPEPFDRKLAAVLPEGTLHAVGGRVRDELRSRLDGIARPLADLDYVVTGIELPDLLERLRRVGRAELIGEAFAVVKATFDGRTVDVALPRRERSTGTGHRDFIVEAAGASVPLEDDLSRRDFRMNMMARRLPGGAVIDPFGGEADIRARRIDILTERSFEEDPLRMLRAAQFAARFDYSPTGRTMAAMRAAAPLAATISAERVRDELIKLLSATRPSVGFDLLRAGGVLAVVLPEVMEGDGVEQNEWHAYDVYRHNMVTMDASPNELILRLAGLLHDVGKPRTKDGPHFYRHELVGETMADELLLRLRFSNDVRERVAALVRHHMYAADPEAEDRTLRRFVQRIGADRVADQFALRAADVAGSGLPKRGDNNERFEARVYALIATKPPLSVRDLAVGGQDVIAAAVRFGLLPEHSRGGPIVGAALAALLDDVVSDPALNERDELIRRLHLFLEQQR